jgi:hypothetical protein
MRQGEWEDTIPFPAKPDAIKVEDRFSTDYKKEDKDAGYELFRDFIEIARDEKQLLLLDNNRSVVMKDKDLHEVLLEFEFKKVDLVIFDGEVEVHVPQEGARILVHGPVCISMDPRKMISKRRRIKRALAGAFMQRVVGLKMSVKVPASGEAGNILSALIHSEVAIECFHMHPLHASCIMKDMLTPDDINPVHLSRLRTTTLLLGRRKRRGNCIADGCTSIWARDGMCCKHWREANNGAPFAIYDRIVCTHVDCPKWQVKDGLCSDHWRKANDGKRPVYCKFVGCTLKDALQGLCQKHWRDANGGTKVFPASARALCERCENIQVLDGYCKSHWREANGGKRFPSAPRLKCIQEGCEKVCISDGMCTEHWKKAANGGKPLCRKPKTSRKKRNKPVSGVLRDVSNT